MMKDKSGPTPSPSRKRNRSKVVNGDSDMDVDEKNATGGNDQPSASKKFEGKSIGRGNNDRPLLYMDTCGGRDFLSHLPLLSVDGKHVLVKERHRVLIFSALTGQFLRTINAQETLSMATTATSGEVVVGGRKGLALWNYELMSLTKRIKISSSETRIKSKSIVDMFLPKDCLNVGEIYLCVTTKTPQTNLHRLNLKDNVCSRIFVSVVTGSQDIGEQGNTLISLGDNIKQGTKSTALLCYDRSLSKVQSFFSDKDRPFTIARCHPLDKIVAVGDKSGRILVFNGIGSGDRLPPAKHILHWHTLAVTALSWSLEGGLLMSGGGERVLCKWLPENTRPGFLPRLGAEIMGINVGQDGAVLQLSDNSLLVLDCRNSPSAQLNGISKNLSGWPAGICFDQRSKSLMLNGRTGQVQVFDPVSKDTYSIDITRQNFLTRDRDFTPANAEVERLAVSQCGLFLCTVDCCWTVVPRIVMKFWHFEFGSQSFVLNTQVDSPHKGGVACIAFQPRRSGSAPVSVLTCGQDKRAKLWRMSAAKDQGTWECVLGFDFRNQECRSACWSSDGTVIAISFQHVITLWDENANLKTTLTAANTTDSIRGLAFGQGKLSRLLHAMYHDQVVSWDLVTLSKVWSVKVSHEPTNMVVCPTTNRVACVGKDLITIIDMVSKVKAAEFTRVNATGAATFAEVNGQPDLYFVTFDGLVKKIGPRRSARKAGSPLIAASHSANGGGGELSNFLNNFAPGSSAKAEIEAETRPAANADHVSSMLTVPLHALPATAALAKSFLLNQVTQLTRELASGQAEAIGGFVEERPEAERIRTARRIEAAFKEQDLRTDLDLKSYCKLLNMKHPD